MRKKSKSGEQDFLMGFILGLIAMGIALTLFVVVLMSGDSEKCVIATQLDDDQHTFRQSDKNCDVWIEVPTIPVDCHDIDEICHEEVHNYAKLCIEEKETIDYDYTSLGNFTCEDITEKSGSNNTIHWIDCYWNDNITKTIKELWDICDGVRIK